MREEDHNINPANIGEINLTLRFMQKTMDSQGALMKEMSNKLDLINGNTVSAATFTEFKTYAESTYAKKTEVAPLLKIIWGVAAIVGTAVVGAVLSLVLIK